MKTENCVLCLDDRITPEETTVLKGQEMKGSRIHCHVHAVVAVPVLVYRESHCGRSEEVDGLDVFLQVEPAGFAGQIGCGE